MPASKVYDMEFDEVSTVDTPANQHGLIVLAKALTQEEQMADFYDVDGNPIDGDPRDVLEVGEYFQDAEGGAYQLTEEDDADGQFDDEAEFDGADERELEAVGKSAFFDEVSKGSEYVLAALTDELHKAHTEEAREAVLTKALSMQSGELAKAQAFAEVALEKAQAAEDRELEKRYIEKAEEFQVAVAPEVLGPVMKRMSESMSYEDCSVINAVLSTSSDVFKQFGVPGEGANNNDPYAIIEGYANDAEFAKSADGRSTLSKEQRTVAFFNANPEAYDEVRRSNQRG